MTNAEPRRNLEDIARRGGEVFARQVRPLLTPQDDGKFVAVDVATGEYEIDGDDYAAVTRLADRKPSAEIWLTRAGEKAAYRIVRGR